MHRMFANKMKKALAVLKKTIMKHLGKNNKYRICPQVAGKIDNFKNTNVAKKEQPVNRLVSAVTKEYTLEEGGIPSYKVMMTSTPTRLKYLRKITILHEVSDLKIYEDIEDNDQVDLSVVTHYEEVEDDNLSFEKSGFRIYENIGQ